MILDMDDDARNERWRGTDDAPLDEREKRERMLWQARYETTMQLRRYGSLDKWPTLLLEPKQFPRCECGCHRVAHKLHGTDRGACTGCTNCRLFSARSGHKDQR
jgi:hypothetical protein